MQLGDGYSNRLALCRYRSSDCRFILTEGHDDVGAAVQTHAFFDAVAGIGGRIFGPTTEWSYNKPPSNGLMVLGMQVDIYQFEASFWVARAYPKCNLGAKLANLAVQGRRKQFFKAVCRQLALSQFKAVDLHSFLGEAILECFGAVDQLATMGLANAVVINDGEAEAFEEVQRTRARSRRLGD
jgi:hypothetical protein